MKVDLEFEEIGTLKASKLIAARLCWAKCKKCSLSWKRSDSKFLNMIIEKSSVFFICDRCAKNIVDESRKTKSD